MLVISSASHAPIKVRVFTLTAGDLPQAPEATYTMRSLPAAERNRLIAVASSTAARCRSVPAYMLTDCHGDGCRAYALPQYSLVPEWDTWQAAVLDACRRLRRWQYYSDPSD